MSLIALTILKLFKGTVWLYLFKKAFTVCIGTCSWLPIFLRSIWCNCERRNIILLHTIKDIDVTLPTCQYINITEGPSSRRCQTKRKETWYHDMSPLKTKFAMWSSVPEFTYIKEIRNVRNKTVQVTSDKYAAWPPFLIVNHWNLLSINLRILNIFNQKRNHEKLKHITKLKVGPYHKNAD